MSSAGSMIYEPPHQQQQQLDTAAMMSEKTSPSFGQVPAARQPSVVMSGPVPVAKESGSGMGVGVPAGSGNGAEPIDDGELRLEVTCGQNQAILYTGRLQLGSKGTCVLFENAWLTPNEFQYVSGRETAKDWKRSIKHHGKSLKVLIAKGILSTTPPARCDCGQCNSSPRKPSSGTDGNAFNTPSSDNKQSSSDCAENWRSGTTDGNSATAATGSAFRPPPDVASSNGSYRNSDCPVSGDQSSGNDDTFNARSAKTHSHQQQQLQSNADQSHSASSTSSSSSPDSRHKKSSSNSSSNSSGKRPRSPSADSAMDHPPSKSQLLDAGHHSSDVNAGRSGEHQSRLGYGSDSSRNHQRQQFSPSADTGSRRREQSSSSSSSQCRTSQSSGGFKSPTAPAHHHFQNGGSGAVQQTSTSQKSSPASGITASTGIDRTLAGSTVDPSCVIPPLAATPYFPLLAAAAAGTTTAGPLPTTQVCYPNPYMMLPLAAAAAAYQNPTAAAAQFPPPYGWNSASVSCASAMVDQSAARHAAGSVSSNGPAFDFPWMRGGACGVPTGPGSAYSSKLSPPPPSMISDPYELAKQSSALGLGAVAQNAYAGYRGSTSTAAAAAAAGFGGLFAAAAADGLDAYDNYLRSSFKVAPPHLTSAAAAAAAGFQQSLFDGQHSAAAAASFGVYPPLFQSPYFGIPSR